MTIFIIYYDSTRYHIPRMKCFWKRIKFTVNLLIHVYRGYSTYLSLCFKLFFRKGLEYEFPKAIIIKPSHTYKIYIFARRWVEYNMLWNLNKKGEKMSLFLTLITIAPILHYMFPDFFPTIGTSLKKIFLSSRNIMITQGVIILVLVYKIIFLVW